MIDGPLPPATDGPYRRDDEVPGCVFCDVDRLPEFEEWPGMGDYGIYRVFVPLSPVVPGHLLVVPATHVADARENPSVTAGSMYVAARVAALRYESANIITSIGTPATQSVMHLHLHLVPRTEGDGLHLPWTGQARA